MKTFQFKILALILGLALASPALSKGNPVFKQVLADFKAGNYSKIDKKYQELLKNKDTLTIYLIAISLAQPSQMAKLEKWTASNPKSPLGWASLGMACLAEAKEIQKTAPKSKAFKEKYAKAESSCDKAFELSPKDINMSSFQIECRKVGGWGRRKK